MSPPVVSAIVVNYRRGDLMAACLGSLRAALAELDEPSELIVVDNASGDGSCDLIRAAAPDALLIENTENLGFAPAVSRAIDRSSGEWVLLVNNDVEVERGFVRELLAAARTAPDVGSVAAQMRFAGTGDVINSAGIGIDRLGVAFDRLLGQPVAASEREPVEVFGACAGAAMFSRAMLQRIGGFDETFFFALDDADVAWRARMDGWRCLYVPAAIALHDHSATIGHGSDLKYFQVGLNRVRMLAKNADRRQLARYGLLMVGYDIAYVVFVALRERTLAPLRGRLQGLREWRSYRRRGQSRRAVELAPIAGLRGALKRRDAWLHRSAARASR